MKAIKREVQFKTGKTWTTNNDYTWTNENECSKALLTDYFYKSVNGYPKTIKYSNNGKGRTVIVTMKEEEGLRPMRFVYTVEL